MATEFLKPELEEFSSGLEQDFPAEPEIPEIPEEPEAALIDQEDVTGAIIDLVRTLEEGDRSAREAWLPVWKKHLLFWRGFQKLITWNRTARDWEYDRVYLGEDEDPDTGIINYYRGYGESIIAALSASIPRTQYFPDDADSFDDIMTSKAYSKIEEMIRNHNNADILITEILFLLYNQGFIAVHNCHVYSKDFGTDVIPIIGYEKVQSEGTDENGLPVTYEDEVPFTEDTFDQPKGRQVLKAYGPLNVKIAHYARRQQDSPYLILEDEVHYSTLRALYPEFRTEISHSNTFVGEERSWRNDVELGETNPQLVTVKQCWLRYEALEAIDDDGIRSKLQAEFPDGLCAVIVNNTVFEMRMESVDEHWTVAKSPLSLTVHADPVGRVMIPVQELRTEMVELTIETIRQGIGETFVDPAVLNFEAYNKVQARPGQKFPINPRPGVAIGNSFHEVRGAVLSKEVEFFFARLNEDGQFVTGAYPSIYGGQLSGGSQTLGEYTASKNQSLQRLSVHYKTIVTLWTRAFDKAVRSYHKHMSGDEKFTTAVGNTFKTVWITELELAGKVAEVRAVTSDQLPTSWEQKRALLFDLLQMKSPQIEAALFHPENVSEVARTLGWSDLYIPGDSDRDVQLHEIAELLQSAPTQDEMGQEQPTIPIDPDVDDNNIHIEVLRAWMTSPQGMDAKRNNPEGYANVRGHLLQHVTYVAQMEAQEIANGNGEPGDDGSGIPSSGGEPGGGGIPPQ